MRKRVGLTAGAVAAVLVLAGCGSSGNGKLLTTGAASQLSFQLTQASKALEADDCQVAATDIANFQGDVNDLTGVNATLVQNLSRAADKISVLANARCPSGITSQTKTNPVTVSTASTTSTTVTTTSSATTTTNQTSTGNGSGGAAPTTTSTPTVLSTPPVTTATESTTSPDSGGAGLNSSSPGGTDSGAGVGQ